MLIVSVEWSLLAICCNSTIRYTSYGKVYLDIGSLLYVWNCRLHRTGQAKDVLLEGLKRLEYRGYDSAGIAVFDGDKLNIVKRLGKVSELVDAVSSDQCSGTCGIGHTRWATHGAPSERNAHPHTSCADDIAVVHNGIIENFTELREELIAKGHTLFLILTPRLLLIL